MIDRITEEQQAISAALANNCKNWHHMPTDQEVSVLKIVVSVLRSLSIFTDALSGEKNLTISVVCLLLGMFWIKFLLCQLKIVLLVKK